MDRIEVTVTMRTIGSYTRQKFSGYGTEEVYIYNMQTDDGTTYVWKTTSIMDIKVLDEKDGWIEDKQGRKWALQEIRRDDIIRIRASVKGQSVYKGQPQTELTRVQVLERIKKAQTPVERMEAKKQQQLESLAEGDFCWTMPYRQYKEHYSDCETLAGSYNKPEYGAAEITVIIRAGRLKASGVRGMHFSGYEFWFTEDGKRYRTTYRAVCEDNAYRRLQKDFPDATDITPGRIYHYGS